MIFINFIASNILLFIYQNEEEDGDKHSSILAYTLLHFN